MSLCLLEESIFALSIFATIGLWQIPVKVDREAAVTFYLQLLPSNLIRNEKYDLKVNDSRYIALFVVSRSIKKLFSIGPRYSRMDQVEFVADNL